MQLEGVGTGHISLSARPAVKPDTAEEQGVLDNCGFGG
jgi:hypothetical protein